MTVPEIAQVTQELTERANKVVADIAAALGGCDLPGLMRAITDLDGTLSEPEYERLCALSSEALALRRACADGDELTTRAKLRKSEEEHTKEYERRIAAENRADEAEQRVAELEAERSDRADEEAICQQILEDSGVPSHALRMAKQSVEPTAFLAAWLA